MNGLSKKTLHVGLILRMGGHVFLLLRSRWTGNKVAPWLVFRIVSSFSTRFGECKSNKARTGPRSSALLLKFLIKSNRKFYKQCRYSSVDRVIDWNAKEPQFDSQLR